MHAATTTLIIGTLLPLLIAVVNQYHWSKPVKGFVALLACLVASAVACFLRGQLDLVNWSDTLVLILGAALVSYQTLWKPSLIAPAIERGTTVTARATG